jgi:transcriptional regulator with XRE-family HTH domain
MDFCKLFGEAVRLERQRRQISQEKLAELCGLHRTYVSGIELGKRNPSLLNIGKIAHALGVSPAELLSNIEGPSQ